MIETCVQPFTCKAYRGEACIRSTSALVVELWEADLAVRCSVPAQGILLCIHSSATHAEMTTHTSSQFCTFCRPVHNFASARSSALKPIMCLQGVSLIVLCLFGIGLPAGSFLCFFIPSIRRRLQEHSRLPKAYKERQEGYYLVRDQHWSRYTLCRQVKILRIVVSRSC
jgi:hypothetical protein